MVVLSLPRTEVILASLALRHHDERGRANRQVGELCAIRTFPNRWIRSTIAGPRRGTRRPRSPAPATVATMARPAESEPEEEAYRPGAMTVRSLVRILVGSVAIAVAAFGCTSPSATSPVARDTGIGGTATAGPVCPVEQNPPDPKCAPRPVAGATIVIQDGSGAQVAVAISQQDGTYFVAVPPGHYVVDPQPVQGLLGTAATQPADVAAGAITDVALEYDTGIR